MKTLERKSIVEYTSKEKIILDEKARKCKQLCLDIKAKLLKETASATSTHKL